jgi:nucleoside-diphosphate-sugar epimerase
VTSPGKVFVTGATGFIGSHLTEKLVREGFEVKTLIRTTSNTSLLQSLDVEMVKGDIRDRAAVEKAVAGCRYVYHLAARTTNASCPRNEYYEVNLKGTQNVCSAVLKANVERFIYGSTAGVYGLIRDPQVDEETKPNPNSHYRESKLLAESSVLDYHRKHGLPAVIARLSSVFGPRSMSWLKLFQDVSARRFRMIGSGENHNQFGYISDIVGGLRLCGAVKDIEGRCYILTGAEALTIRDLIDLIAREFGEPFPYPTIPLFAVYPFQTVAELAYKAFHLELPFSHQMDFFLSDRVLTIAKAQKDLGYSPAVTMKEGIGHTVKWYRENGYL